MKTRILAIRYCSARICVLSVQGLRKWHVGGLLMQMSRFLPLVWRQMLEGTTLLSSSETALELARILIKRGPIPEKAAVDATHIVLFLPLMALIFL